MGKKKEARLLELSLGLETLPEPEAYAWAGEAPVGITDEQAARLRDIREDVCGHLSGHRLAHSVSVARTAGRMASTYGVDPYLAIAAGFLHDWDKHLSRDELWEKAQAWGVTSARERDERLAPVLHGLTAAASLPSRYPDLPPEVFRAISRHTVGAPNMAPLDMVIYVADMLEPLRGSDMDELRALITEPLESLFAACACRSALFVLATGRYLAPEAVEVWNAYEPCLPASMKGKRCRILYETA